jgi:hypothetical protein
MDCLVKLEKYNHVISQYEHYLDFFPNYRDMDQVVNNIKFIIEQYEVMGHEQGAVRGNKLLLKIDRFNKDGREAYFIIADEAGGHAFLQRKRIEGFLKLLVPAEVLESHTNDVFERTRLARWRGAIPGHRGCDREC